MQGGASQGLRGAGQGSQAAAQRSCLLARRRHTRPDQEGWRPWETRLHRQSLSLVLSRPEGSQRGSKLSVLRDVLQPWPHRFNQASPLLPFPDLHLLPRPDSPTPGLLQLTPSLSKPAWSGFRPWGYLQEWTATPALFWGTKRSINETH